MSTEFRMPKLGLTMEEGTVVEWLVPDGTEVTSGTPVLVIATDKVETEVEVPDSGRLHQIAASGSTFSCGEVIGVLLAEGEAPPAAAPPAATAAPATAPSAPATEALPAATSSAAPAVAARASDGRILASPNARRVAAQAGLAIEQIRGTGPGGRIVSEDVEEALASGAPRVAASAPAVRPAGGVPHMVPPGSATTAVVPATVAARNLADLLGVDLAGVAPDPVDGRITRDGVALHVRALLARLTGPAPAPATAAAIPAAAAPPPPATQPPTSVVPLKGMRGTIAKRMHQSLQEMAQLTLHMDADMEAVVADRRNRVRQGAAPGYTDYVMAAAARALRDHPMVNAQVTDEGVALLPDIHVGLAVAVDGGLMVPVVRHTDQLGLDDLSEVTTRLAHAARDKTLALDDLEGGTFSVSALGMFGVDGFTPVINPPNVAILGVGRLRDDLELVDGEVTAVKRMTLSLTWDHRVIDGAPAAEFCRSVVQHLQDPEALDSPA
jgi:pyruvate dehydrogenase E2 component (dihydrolipoamide acetyltransferase)